MTDYADQRNLAVDLADLDGPWTAARSSLLGGYSAVACGNIVLAHCFRGEEVSAYIAAASPEVVLGLLERIAELESESFVLMGERDEARQAVRRLAEALASAVSGLEYCRDLSERQDVINCATGGVRFGDEALADEVVRRIVEGG